MATREAVAAVLLCILAAGGVIASCDPQPPAVAPASGPRSVSSAAAPASVFQTPSVAAPIVPHGDVQPVTRVIDGDTFMTPEGKVRVLVMDSCEHGTPGGDRATSDAHLILDGKSVTLTAQPGHDRDGYGRLLRYVTLPDGQDYADYMLGFDHTAVYEGHNDASAAKVAEGRAADTDGRTCAPAPAPVEDSGSSSPSLGNGDDDHHYNHRDGALTGGYCARKWWC